MSFEQQVKQWVSIDTQIKLLNDKIRDLREQKHKASEMLFSYAENNNLKNPVIQISDGKLKFTTTRIPAPLTFRYIEKSLGEVIKNETQVKQIVEYLKNKREIKSVSEIKRFSSN